MYACEKYFDPCSHLIVRDGRYEIGSVYLRRGLAAALTLRLDLSACLLASGTLVFRLVFSRSFSALACTKTQTPDSGFDELP